MYSGKTGVAGKVALGLLKAAAFNFCSVLGSVSVTAFFACEHCMQSAKQVTDNRYYFFSK